MQSNFRNFAIWVVIALLLVALFNLFQNPSQRRRGTISPTRSSSTRSRTSRSRTSRSRATASDRYLQGRRRRLYHLRACRPGLVERLRKSDVNIRVRPTEDEVPSFLSVLVSWFPMLLLIGVWIFFMRQMQAGSGPRHGLRQVEGQAADGAAWAASRSRTSPASTRPRPSCRRSSSSCATRRSSSGWAGGSRAAACWSARRAPARR